MNNIDYLIFKNYKNIWDNFVIYTSDDFKNKWSNLDCWNHFTNFKTFHFLNELVNEISNCSNELLILFNQWSKKNNIEYLTSLTQNKLNFSYIKNNDKNYIISSCFTPPELSFLTKWTFEKSIEKLDDVLDNDIERLSNYSFKSDNDDPLFVME